MCFHYSGQFIKIQKTTSNWNRPYFNIFKVAISLPRVWPRGLLRGAYFNFAWPRRLFRGGLFCCSQQVPQPLKMGAKKRPPQALDNDCQKCPEQPTSDSSHCCRLPKTAPQALKSPIPIALGNSCCRLPKAAPQALNSPIPLALGKTCRYQILVGVWMEGGA